MIHYPDVEELLKNYHGIKLKLRELKALLQEVTWEITEEEAIEELTFKKSQEEKVQTSHLQDTTSRVALTYEDMKNQRNTLGKIDLERLIALNQWEIKKLESSISILRGRHRTIIEGLYLEKISQGELCKRLFISQSTLNRCRRKAIETMAEFLSILV